MSNPSQHFKLQKEYDRSKITFELNLQRSILQINAKNAQTKDQYFLSINKAYCQQNSQFFNIFQQPSEILSYFESKEFQHSTFKDGEIKFDYYGRNKTSSISILLSKYPNLNRIQLELNSQKKLIQGLIKKTSTQDQVIKQLQEKNKAFNIKEKQFFEKAESLKLFTQKLKNSFEQLYKNQEMKFKNDLTELKNKNDTFQEAIQQLREKDKQIKVIDEKATNQIKELIKDQEKKDEEFHSKTEQKLKNLALDLKKHEKDLQDKVKKTNTIIFSKAIQLQRLICQKTNELECQNLQIKYDILELKGNISNDQIQRQFRQFKMQKQILKNRLIDQDQLLQAQIHSIQRSLEDDLSKQTNLFKSYIDILKQQIQFNQNKRFQSEKIAIEHGKHIRNLHCQVQILKKFQPHNLINAINKLKQEIKQTHDKNAQAAKKQIQRLNCVDQQLKQKTQDAISQGKQLVKCLTQQDQKFTQTLIKLERSQQNIFSILAKLNNVDNSIKDQISKFEEKQSKEEEQRRKIIEKLNKIDQIEASNYQQLSDIINSQIKSNSSIIGELKKEVSSKVSSIDYKINNQANDDKIASLIQATEDKFSKQMNKKIDQSLKKTYEKINSLTRKQAEEIQVVNTMAKQNKTQIKDINTRQHKAQINYLKLSNDLQGAIEKINDDSEIKKIKEQDKKNKQSLKQIKNQIKSWKQIIYNNKLGNHPLNKNSNDIIHTTFVEYNQLRVQIVQSKVANNFVNLYQIIPFSKMKFTIKVKKADEAKVFIAFSNKICLQQQLCTGKQNTDLYTYFKNFLKELIGKKTDLPGRYGFFYSLKDNDTIQCSADLIQNSVTFTMDGKVLTQTVDCSPRQILYLQVASSSKIQFDVII